jgi:beta-glucosidase
MEDTYLPAFRAAIVEGQAGSIMCAYNRVNGEPACASQFLLQKKLRGDWGFKGYVVSDCGALDDISAGHKFTKDAPSAVAAAIKTGVDNECGVSPVISTLINRYGEAVARGLLTEAEVDTTLIRLFAARMRSGDIDATGKLRQPAPARLSLVAAHRALAIDSATKSVVLLKNTGVLPLQRRALRVVVTGPLADSTRVLRGNYSSSTPPDPVSVLAGLKAEFGDALITYVPAAPSYTDGDPVPASALQTAAGKPGVQVECYALQLGAAGAAELALLAPGGPKFESTPFRSAVVPDFNLANDPQHSTFRTVMSGVLVPPATGNYRLGLKGTFGSLFIDGKPFAQMGGFPFSPLGDLKTIHMEQGHRYAFRLEAIKTVFFGAQVVWTRVDDAVADTLRAAARGADAIIAVVGLNSDLEGEEVPLAIPGFAGGDRTSLDLPTDQQRLLEAAAATGKPVVMVNLSGSAINLAWAKEHAAAILQAWYPGEAGGTAVARVLSGASNPGGRLPLTFYRDVAELPPFDDYAMRSRTYRYFSGTPVYPFGHGLSYTSFAYGPVVVDSPDAGGVIAVHTTLKNTGARVGDEVAQLYLRFPDDPGAPRIALRGFQRVHLAAGDSRRLTFRLTPRDLSTVATTGERRVLAGSYRVSVGGGQPDTGAAGASAEFRYRSAAAIPP